MTEVPCLVVGGSYNREKPATMHEESRGKRADDIEPDRFNWLWATLRRRNPLRQWVAGAIPSAPANARCRASRRSKSAKSTTKYSQLASDFAL